MTGPSKPSCEGAAVVDIKATILASGEGGNASEETLLVRVEAAGGEFGWGEANAAAPAVKAYLDRGQRERDGWDDSVRTLLLGEDACNPRALWQLLRSNTFWSARAGVGYVALAALDMALWDLAGKLHGKPVWQLLGDRVNPTPRAYATIYHGKAHFPKALAQSLEGVDRALAAGFEVIKVEAVPENTDRVEQSLELVREVLARIEGRAELLIDFGYRFRTFAEAKEILTTVDRLGVWAIEAPFPPELVDEYRQLRDCVATPIATGDCLTAPEEYFPLLDAGLVDVVQAGAPRTGISGMDELARRAAMRGKQFVPWGWVTSALSASANIHLAVVHGNVPLVEYGAPFLYPENSLRRTLVVPEPEIVQGSFVTPTEPGLGVTVDPEAFARFSTSF